MKNSQKGFVVPVLLVVIALLVIGGGVYLYQNKKIETSVVNTETPQSNQTQQTNIQAPPISTQTTSKPSTSQTQQTNIQAPPISTQTTSKPSTSNLTQKTNLPAVAITSSCNQNITQNNAFFGCIYSGKNFDNFRADLKPIFVTDKVPLRLTGIDV